LEADRAIEDFKGKVLWVHDQDDPVCSYKDLENFKNKDPKNTIFLITNNLGHNKILQNTGCNRQNCLIFSLLAGFIFIF
jgi:pimeloyl-ACP methyl ester carboxylesterase